jgi:carboxypeptidase Q
MGITFDKKLIESLPDVSSESVYEYLRGICNIGVRWPGTQGEEDAVDFMYTHLKEHSDSVELEHYLYPCFTPGDAQCEIVSPMKRGIPCIPLEYSENGSMKGEIVYVGRGYENDFKAFFDAGNTVNQKIVLVNTNRPYVTQKYMEKKGALGLIVISDSPFGSLRQITSQMGFEKDEDLTTFGADIPGVVISRESGDLLLSLASGGPVEVRMEQHSTVEMKKAYNVVSSIYGEKYPDEKVLVGAHYDTQFGIVGAWDNGSGCAALIEINRMCYKTKPARTMVFCSFGGEEIGLFGSTNFVRARTDELEDFKLYVNLDSTSSDVCYIHELVGTEKTIGFAQEMISGFTDWNVTQQRTYASIDYDQDSAPFVWSGVNAVWAHEEGNAFFHTQYDTIETISPKKLERATRVALLPFYYVSNIRELPF